jgi:hypothetical protein
MVGEMRFMNLSSGKLNLLLGIFVVFCLILMIVEQTYADRPRQIGHHAGRDYEYAERGDNGSSKSLGEISAWLFGIANFPVVLSIFVKICAKSKSLDEKLRERMEWLNRRQKKYLMKLHYWLNPVAFGVAVFHFAMSECRSTVMPELGMGVMFLVFILGLMMTFKLSPASMRKAVFKFHTSPVLLVVVVSILLIGHSIVD